MEGTDRNQTGFWSLDELVGEESMVRVIDRFIDVTDLSALGFLHMEPAATGRPRYATPALAKLYVYGYENGIRSSRKLERETRRNVEVMWLMGNLTPDYKTISEFRRENIRPLQKLFREFVKLCRSWDLVGGTLVAVDGSKIKASNNKKNNFSRKKLKQRLALLDEKIERYMAELEEADRQDDGTAEAPKGLQEVLARKELYENYLAQIEAGGSNEVSTVDPDARLMGNNRGGVDVAYNVQSAVDGQEHIVLDYDVSLNPSDQGKLSYMVKRLKRYGYKHFKALADKGYYNGRDLRMVKKYKVTAIVSRQEISNPKNQPEQFHTDQFFYDAKTDTYRCPMGQTLHPHNKKTAARRNFFNKTACADCPHRKQCTRKGNQFRTITRSQYSDIYDEAERTFKENLHLYKLRQQIVEHPFGTIKHTMNGGYFLLRTRRKVRCEVALLFLGYNLKRAYNKLGFRELMERLNRASHQLFCMFRISSLNQVFTAAG
jgi:transposase